MKSAPKIGGDADWDTDDDDEETGIGIGDIRVDTNKRYSNVSNFSNKPLTQRGKLSYNNKSVRDDIKDDFTGGLTNIDLFSTEELLNQLYLGYSGNNDEIEEQMLKSVINYLDDKQGLTSKLKKLKKNYFRDKTRGSYELNSDNKDNSDADGNNNSNNSHNNNNNNSGGNDEINTDMALTIKKKLKNKKSVGKKRTSIVKKPKQKVYNEPILKGKLAKYYIGKNPCIEIDISVHDRSTGKPIGIKGTLSIVLFKKQRPKAVKNFLALMGCTSDKTNKYLKKGTKKVFHSYTKMESLFTNVDTQEGLIKCGDVIKEDGTGGIVSIYGKNGFDNENSKNEFLNHQKYTLAMININGKNGCQYYINMEQQYQRNFKNVVFGYIVDDKAREFMDTLYECAFKNDNNIPNSKMPDMLYKINIKNKKPVRYPVANHLVALKNSMM
mmetsp:Transcript_50267/g.61667  ORF Transcript_50267/g.61667 Transcript_50267/m.61667 type:complete len:439 (-) Transcript_50267:83-1399(-)